jgi:hypothetical protein
LNLEQASLNAKRLVENLPGKVGSEQRPHQKPQSTQWKTLNEKVEVSTGAFEKEKSERKTVVVFLVRVGAVERKRSSRSLKLPSFSYFLADDLFSTFNGAKTLIKSSVLAGLQEAFLFGKC